MNYCGECGARLDPRDQTISFCPECGAALDPIAGTTAPASRPASLWSRRAQVSMTPAQRNGWRWTALVALAALLVLAAASAVIFTLHGLPGASASPPTAHGTGGSHAMRTPAVSPSTTPGGSSTTGAGNTPTTAPGATATASPAATADPVGTITATAQPYLSVSPTSITCSATNPPTFIVKNSGGGNLNWTASTEATYTISPPSGSLPGGQQTPVTVSGAGFTAQIKVTADGAGGSPQYVWVNCAV